MEDNFYNDGFEEFLQQQVKDSKMYPSDGLWRKIHKEVHGDTNWPGLTIAAFGFLAAIIAISFYFSPFPGIDERTISVKSSPVSKTKNTLAKAGDLVAAAPRKENHPHQVIPFVGDDDDNPELADEVVRKMVQSSSTPSTPPETLSIVAGKVEMDNTPARLIPLHPLAPVVSMSSPKYLQADLALSDTDPNGEHLLGDSAGQLQVHAPLEPAIVPASTKPGAEKPNTAFEDDYLTRSSHDVQIPTPVKSNRKLKNKIGYTVYITPSNSYRKLIENDINRTGGKPGPVALYNLVDINKVVRHKPGTGIEAGVNFMYSITDKLKATAGVQFNIRQYSMEAYMATTEVATIGLINRSGGIDSIGSYAVYRNSNGYKPTELVNRYYQVSLPVGLQWQVLGNRSVQLHVAATVQPTYFLNRNTYLISTDYQNYTQNPGIVRPWNINAGLETFITLKSGDFKWQLGPQVRYQNLPTFIKAYPIREYLVDYGVKLGVSTTIK
ncbi:hypothetical protein EXU57_22260 [Segetibacter sp. 3557_3]|uniref:hypothetical protein n=1 Tax=Segetibacter sp. 3557_3 TaxID=2547429 RepID=UPI00105876B9|nr:hypothetical protein [Segetibacter sp. 3557_3]TDH19786.1 hypothetical protein EXU57_22260 [Segetibacter sp. 3557_3]